VQFLFLIFLFSKFRCCWEAGFKQESGARSQEYEDPRNPQNKSFTLKLCYINAVASSLQVHGDSSQDGSGGSLDSSEGQCSIGFQPVTWPWRGQQ
jgi:hypothetical protein